MMLYIPLVVTAFVVRSVAVCVKPLIIDTDLLNFDDDPLAIGIANIFESWGQVKILGIASSVSAQYAPSAIDAINTFYGHGDIPVSIHKPVTNMTQDPVYTKYGDYITGLTFNFSEDIRNGANTSDPVTMYRTLLATASDNSVTIACIGTMDNLYRLILSGPDSISPLSGMQLITRKVYEMAVQANAYGESFNLDNHNTTFAQIVLNSWPSSVKLTFIGDNIGNNVKFGAKLTTELDLATNPVAYAFNKSVGYNVTHSTWDATAMYYAIRGLDDVYAYNFTSGSVVADSDALTAWNVSNTATSTQNAVVFKNGGIGNDSLSERLESILLWQPGTPIPSALTAIAGCPVSNNMTMPSSTGALTPGATITQVPYTGSALGEMSLSSGFFLFACSVAATCVLL